MKIEFDLPNFEKELNINIIIRKDGEVVYSASSSFPDDDYKDNAPNSMADKGSIVDEKPKAKKRAKEKEKEVTPESTAKSKGAGGNFMNMDF